MACNKSLHQTGALLRKNALLKIRDWRTTMWEVLLPVVFVALLVALRSVIDKEDNEADLHLGEQRTFNASAAWEDFARRMDAIDRKIGFAPDTPYVRQLVADLRRDHPLVDSLDLTRIFSTESAFVSYVESSGYGNTAAKPGLWSAVVVEEADLSVGQLKYMLRLNGTGDDGDDPPNGMSYPQFVDEWDQLQIGYEERWWQVYYERGETALQHYVETHFLNASGAQALGSTPTVTVQPFPTPKHFEDPFAGFFSTTIGLFFTFVYLYAVTRITGLILAEKEAKIKEMMLMMGMQNRAIWISWFVTYFFIFTVSSAIVVAVSGSSLFEMSDKFIIFLLFLLFGVSVFSFSLLMSVFFTRARVGSNFAAIIFLIAFFPTFALEDTASSKGVGCLSAPICFGLGADVALQLESSQQGVHWSNLDADVDGANMSLVLGMLFFDSVIYMLAALYFEQVVPSDYGIQKPWYFCLLPFKCWSDSSGAVSPAHSDGSAPSNAQIQMRPVNPDEPPSVRVNGLVRSFHDGEVLAVNGLSFDMYQGEITALLGHNGAGKSTTINMLSGMLPPSGGDATVFGKSMVHDMEELRKSMGVCPQHNVLFDELTVREHMEMYAKIKSVAEPVNEKIEKLVREVALLDKIDERAGALSGGQKRKVHIAIALLGDSKFVVLDEPTAGVDPYSRRLLWNLLEREKRTRTILLTTHHLEEADYLSQYVVIMSKGKVRAAGSPLFLKGAFGVGYSLVVSKQHAKYVKGKPDGSDGEVDIDQDIIDAVRSHVPAAEIVAKVAGEIRFRLSFEDAEKFPNLLRQLDAMQEAEGGVESWSFSVTTLEDVFLSSRHEPDAYEAPAKQIERRESLRRTASDRDSHRESLSLDKEDDGAVDISMARHVRSMLIKRFHNAKRDRKLMMWTMMYPLILLVAGVGLIKLGQSTDPPTLNVDTSELDTPSYVPYNVDDGNIAALDAGQLFPGNNRGDPISGLGADNNTVVAMQQYLLSTGYSSSSVHKESRHGAFSRTAPDAVCIHFNTTAVSALPIFMNLWHNALLHSSGPTSTERFIQLRIKQLPETANEDANDNFLFAMMIGIAFAFVPASFAAFAAHERISRAKHLQYLAGAKPTAYWLSNVLWDLANYAVPALLCLMVIAMYDLSELLGSAFGATFVIVVLFGTSVIPFSYLVSFLFETSSSAQNMVLLANIFLGSLLLIVTVVLDSISDSTKDVSEVLKFIFRFVPIYSFCDGLSNILSRASVSRFGESKGAYDMEISGYAIIYMCVTTVAYLTALLVIEKVLRTPAWLAKCIRVPHVEDDTPQEEDEDVVAERQRVSSGAADGSAVIVKGLRKVFPAHHGAKPKAAVKEVSFSIDEGQCLGLLGVNGAGKTTTMRMLTGELVPSAGQAFLAGYDIATQAAEVRALLGFVPQFDDALHAKLTAEEHFTLFCRIKGLPEDRVPQRVQQLVHDLELEDFAHLPVGGYSGGNKRKVSLGVALCGNPKILVLDEVSAGLDAGARHFMREAIAGSMKGRAVILTSHSLEEVQALSDKIVIMVDGRLRCIGSAPHLKKRFGDGFQLEAYVEEGQSGVLTTFLREHFGDDMTVLEQHEKYVKVRLPRGDFQLPDVFELIVQNKDQLGLQEWSLSEPTLESIFLDFARTQESVTSGQGAELMPPQVDHGSDHELRDVEMSEVVVHQQEE